MVDRAKTGEAGAELERGHFCVVRLIEQRPANHSHAPVSESLRAKHGLVSVNNIKSM